MFSQLKQFFTSAGMNGRRKEKTFRRRDTELRFSALLFYRVTKHIANPVFIKINATIVYNVKHLKYESSGFRNSSDPWNVLISKLEIL